jgi:hypothetical protein
MFFLVIYILIGVAAFALLAFIFVRTGKQEAAASPQYRSQKALEEYGDPAMLNLYLNAKSNEEREEIASFVNEALAKRRQQQKTAAIKPTKDEEDLTRELPLKAREQQAEDTLAIENILAAPAYQFWQEPALNEKRASQTEEDFTTSQDQLTTVYRKAAAELCPVCGEPLEASCDFCIYCGNKMAILAEPAPLAPPPAIAPIPIMPAKKAPRHRSTRNKEPEVMPEPTVQATEPLSMAEPEPPAAPESPTTAAGNAFCIYCGEPMEPGNTFCIYCGATVDEAAAPEPGMTEPAYEEESYTKVIYETPAAGEPVYAAETYPRDVYAEPEYEADEPSDNEELEFSEPAIRQPDYEEQYGEDDLDDAEPDLSDILQSSTAAASPASPPRGNDYDDAYADDYDDEGNYEDDLDEAPVNPFAQPTGLATGSTQMKQPMSLQEILDNMRALEEKIFAEVAAAEQETRDIPPLDPLVKPVKKNK